MQHYAMKTCGGSGGSAPPFLTSARDGGNIIGQFLQDNMYKERVFIPHTEAAFCDTCNSYNIISLKLPVLKYVQNSSGIFGKYRTQLIDVLVSYLCAA
jgi:hypothetical protein